VNGNNCNPDSKNSDPPTEENDLMKLLACCRRETQERLKVKLAGSLMWVERSAGGE